MLLNLQMYTCPCRSCKQLMKLYRIQLFEQVYPASIFKHAVYKMYTVHVLYTQVAVCIHVLKIYYCVMNVQCIYTYIYICYSILFISMTPKYAFFTSQSIMNGHIRNIF